MRAWKETGKNRKHMALAGAKVTAMKATAIMVAKKAGSYLLQNFRQHPALLKARATAKELHTRYDKTSDKMIIREISKKFPTHTLLTEESGFIGRKSSYTWIIDSLDGTTNFSRGNPFFSVSIALACGEDSRRENSRRKNSGRENSGKKLLLGVIYAPFLGELYVAEKGKGAFLNGKRIHVSSRGHFETSYFLSCEGADRSNERIARVNALFHARVKDLRKLGSAALEMAAVASGKAEAYLTTSMDPWDVAAGILLVEEAGGNVTDFKGKEWGFERTALIASNGIVHDKVLRRLDSVSMGK